MITQAEFELYMSYVDGWKLAARVELWSCSGYSTRYVAKITPYAQNGAVYGMDVTMPSNPMKMLWTSQDDYNVTQPPWVLEYSTGAALPGVASPSKLTCTCDMVSLLNAGCPSARGKPCRSQGKFIAGSIQVTHGTLR